MPLSASLRAVALAFALLAGADAAATAADSDAAASAMALLTEKSAKKRAAGVEALAASGHPAAAAILAAMAEGRLHFRRADKRIVITERKGRTLLLTEPLTGERAGEAPAADFRKVRVNNRLRRLIRGALGTLNLAHPDPARRLAAAFGLMKSRDPAVRPALASALERERDDGVRDAFALALAAIDIRPDASKGQRIRAVRRLGESVSAEARSLLAAAAGDGEGDGNVRAAARAALQQIDDRLEIYRYLGALAQGLSLGSVLLLAAMGLAITFGVMGVINMAHGEMVMLGAYAAFVVQQVLHDLMPEALWLSLPLALPVAFLGAGAMGVVLERSVIRFLYGRPLETLLATWGVSLALRQAVRTVFGPTNQEVSSPDWMSGAFELAGGISITYNRIWIFVFALAVLGAVALLIRFTAFGLEMRAVVQNRRMANSMGIRSARVDALTFGLGSGIAGMAGVALSQIDNVSPNLGQNYIVDSFMVVVFGGVGNLWGTLVGALSLGVVNKILEPFSGAVLGKILVLVAIILFIQKHPRGLFALRGRAAES